MRKITNAILNCFYQNLIEEEKSSATVEKYMRDAKEFAEWIGDRDFDKSDVLEYKQYLIGKYATASVNSMLSSINSLFSKLEWFEMRVKTIKMQRKIFSSSEKELTKSEYERLLKAAKSKNNERLYLLMQTICATGIRVSEVKYITCEAIRKEWAEVSNKGKNRRIYIPRELCKMLKEYCVKQKISSGPVFITKNGKTLDRSNIWSDMKKLCKEANVSEGKVFPHNLRHLFARTFYSIQKDIVRLADILGHSSVNTTRIYTVESGEIHHRQIQKLGLLLC